MSATVDTFPKSMKATRRMTITEKEFEEICRAVRYSSNPDVPHPHQLGRLKDFQWIIERVADGTILVEG